MVNIDGLACRMRASIASSSHPIALTRRQIEICASERISGPPRSLACAKIRSFHRLDHAEFALLNSTNIRCLSSLGSNCNLGDLCWSARACPRPPALRRG